MTLQCRGSRLLLLLAMLAAWMQACRAQDSALLFISHTGTISHRVHCLERLVCIGRGNNVFWTFLGGGISPIMDSEFRMHMSQTTAVNDGLVQTTATLTFDPVIPRFPESYVCQILGDNPTAANVLVNIDEAPAAITSTVPSTVNISTMTINDPVLFACQVDTCRTDYTVTFFVNGTSEQTFPPAMGMNGTFLYEFNLQANSAGTYTCVVNIAALSFMSEPETLILTGVPRDPPTTQPPGTSQPGNSQAPGSPQPSATVPMMTPSPTAAAAGLHLLLPLFLMTLVISLTVNTM